MFDFLVFCNLYNIFILIAASFIDVMLEICSYE